MRSLKLSGVAALLAVVAGAQAQSVAFHFNKLGDAAGAKPSVIQVTPGTHTFSVYYTTTGVGATSQVGALFGYTTSTTSGAAATPAASPFSFSSVEYGSSAFTNGAFPLTQGGGGGVSDGTVRPYGANATVFTLTTFPSADGANVKFFDITLTVANQPGLYTFSLHGANTEDYASFVYDASNNPVYAGTYSAQIEIVPEPATMLALAGGVAVLLRRRRS